MAKIRVGLMLISTCFNKSMAQCNSDDPLACFNGGTCHDGPKSYQVLGLVEENGYPFSFLEEQIRGMHCQCPNEPAYPGHVGLTGVHCSIHYEMCPDETMCFNGGTCEAEQYDIYRYRCLCPWHTEKDVWTGRNCEIPATDFCGEEDPISDLIGGVWFCSNGGNCVDGELNLAEKCDCPEETFGLHCEFKEDVPCNLKCSNNGVCKVGLKDFSQMSEYGLDIESYLGGQDHYGEHCVCPEGFTGVTCEVEESVQCGKGVCFNGAECVQTVSLDGSTIFNEFCRCPQDHDQSYAGKFCEHESTVFCPTPDGHDKSQYFCANGGECPSEPHLSCNCLDGYSGPKCEVSPDARIHDECDLDCKNGGECFFGQSPIIDEYEKDLYMDGLDFLLDNKHCRCPPGYVGLRCEIRYEKCGENEHYCLHGSGCVSDNDMWTCDCESASTLLSTAYAGEYCEHAATEFCEGPGAHQRSFCTNHGTCLGEIGPAVDHVGCKCHEGWTGEYCEFESQATDGIATKAFVGFVCALFGTVICFSFLVLHRKRNMRHKYEAPGHDIAPNPYGEDGDSDLSEEETDYEFQEIRIM